MMLLLHTGPKDKPEPILIETAGMVFVPRSLAPRCPNEYFVYVKSMAAPDNDSAAHFVHETIEQIASMTGAVRWVDPAAKETP